jgi:uncharacterized protein
MLKDDNLLIKKSKIDSYGDFTIRNIRKGTILFIFPGGLENINIIRKNYGEHFLDRCLEVDYGVEAMTIKGSFSWYVNHSCNPNCGISGNSIISMKDIRKDEEITFDYSMSLASNSWKMKCTCNSINCRKIIGCFFGLPEKLKKKYLPYSSNHIRRKFKIPESPLYSMK